MIPSLRRREGRYWLHRDLAARYLKLLDVPPRPPSPDALAELVAAQVRRVPFETVSKLYYRSRFNLSSIPPLPLFLEGAERYRFGGTCYACNFHLYSLLESLGYAVKLCGADMHTPDCHIVNIVQVQGREYLVDAGYAAPFLAPLPRDLPRDFSISLGRDRYVLQPQDALGRSRLVLYRDGVAKHGYLAKPEPKRIENFAGVIAASFLPASTFMNALLLARFAPGYACVVHNLRLIESRGQDSKATELADRNALITAIVERFGMPADLVRDAIAHLPLTHDAWA